MQQNAEALAAATRIPCVEVRSLPDPRVASLPALAICAPLDFMQRVEPAASGTKLPACWNVTSDSIAARLAIVFDAVELVLLKSCLPSETNLAGLAADGYVDRFLPTLSNELPPLRAVNLRDKTYPEVRVQSHPAKKRSPAS